MLLADMGADIVTVTRAGGWKPDPRLFVNRNRRVVTLDLKQAHDVDEALALVSEADFLIEGFRPGVMERLGLGPEVVLRRNPKIAYGRMTGWGQDGPLAQAAGHDINFIAAVGALDTIRSLEGAPVFPLNLLGDYAGGATFLVMGLLSAVIHARFSGQGQVVDAAMCDGVASLTTPDWSRRATGRSSPKVGSNVLDGAAPYYNVYQCRDGAYLAVGASEPKFYAELCGRIGLDDAIDMQRDKRAWPELKRRFAERFASRTSAEWEELLRGTDACVTRVRPASEAPSHPQLAARRTFVEHDGHLQPAPAPRFSATPLAISQSADVEPVPPAQILEGWREEGA